LPPILVRSLFTERVMLTRTARLRGLRRRSLVSGSSQPLTDRGMTAPPSWSISLSIRVAITSERLTDRGMTAPPTRSKSLFIRVVFASERGDEFLISIRPRGVDRLLKHLSECLHRLVPAIVSPKLIIIASIIATADLAHFKDLRRRCHLVLLRESKVPYTSSVVRSAGGGSRVGVDVLPDEYEPRCSPAGLIR